MKKIGLMSKDLIGNNIEQIQSLFPNCITEQEGKKVVDFDKLKLELSGEISDDTREKYQLTWPGKKEAIKESLTPTKKTLVPLKDKSEDFDNTKNVYIEGDNLEVLKILQESYLNSIKCIYIDPPYNTGKDFIYNDNFKKTTSEELIDSEQVDDDGNKYTLNTESNGRYHSDWLSMMYPRLKLARNLLKEDGVIFISIDDNESDNLKKICDEIFGEINFICEFVWQKNFAPKNDNKYVSISTEKIYMYAKNKKLYKLIKLERTDEQLKSYKNLDNDSRGAWSSGTLLATTFSEKYVYTITSPNGINHTPPNGRCWRFSQERLQQLIEDNRIWFGKDGNGVPRIKRFLSEMDPGIVPQNFLPYSDVGSGQTSNGEITNLFGTQIFNFPKPLNLIQRFINLCINNDDSDIILDFFSGSATTAHASMDLNSSKNSNLKYILVQLEESVDEKNSTQAYEFCIENNLEPIIPSIAQERIRRAAAKIKEETNADIDYGFRVFKLSESTLKDNFNTPAEIKQSELELFDNKYIDEASKMDILTHIILDLGLKLDVSIKELGNDNYIIEESLLYVCLSDSFTVDILDDIISIKPDKVVLNEKSFNKDAELINVVEQLKVLLPDTEVSII